MKLRSGPCHRGVGLLNNCARGIFLGRYSQCEKGGSEVLGRVNRAVYP